MSIAFTKMHGLGNDFLVIRGNDLTPFDQDTIRRLADRRTGVGFDQLLWLERPRQERMFIFESLTATAARQSNAETGPGVSHAC